MSYRSIILLVVATLNLLYQQGWLGALTPGGPPPIALDGLNVLVVEETEARPLLPGGQIAVLQSTAIPNYVEGKGGVYRELDQQPSTANLSKPWQDAMARPRQSLPWILVSNGKSGFEGPLPPTEEATLELVKKYGGD